jgi:hypothetical protein
LAPKGRFSLTVSFKFATVLFSLVTVASYSRVSPGRGAKTSAGGALSFFTAGPAADKPPEGFAGEGPEVRGFFSAGAGRGGSEETGAGRFVFQ